MYDNQIGRWMVIDPKVGKYSSLSPYDFVGGNPIKRFDPDGMDWYNDEKGTMQFDPKVQSQKDLKDGQKYVGDTYQDKNKKGKVITEYRSDGSIMFSRQKDAYNRMYNNSKANGNREEFGIVMKNGVLVLPDYKNGDSEVQPGVDYDYKFDKGKLIDPVDKTKKDILGTIHTHLSSGGDPTPSYYTGADYGDVGYHAQNTPYKIFMTIGWDGKVHGNYAYYQSGSNVPSYSIVSKYLKQGGLTNNDLLNGYDLIQVLQSLIIKQ